MVLGICVLCGVIGAIFGFVGSRLFVAKGILQVDDTNEEKVIFRFVVDGDLYDIPNKSHILLKVKKTKITQ